MLQFTNNQKIANNNKSWQGCEEIRTIMHVGGAYVGTTIMARNLAASNKAENVHQLSHLSARRQVCGEYQLT